MSCGKTRLRNPATERLTELLAKVAQGDQRAFAELHAATFHKLRRTVLTVSPSAADLDDLLQDAYLKIWKHAVQFDPRRASPITWMCTIVRNTAIDARRLKQVATTELDEALAVPDGTQAEDDFDFDAAQPIAARAIQNLSDDRRQLLSLAYLEGASRSVLAQRFDVPVGTVKTWLRRTLESLRRECLAGGATLPVTQIG